jgi:acylphosphatase
MRCRFEVTGRVQGVGFRAHARAVALQHRLVGWIENRADGSVAGEAAGSEAGLRAFAAWLRTGPPFARVDRLSWSEIAETPGEITFEVRR